MLRFCCIFISPIPVHRPPGKINLTICMHLRDGVTYFPVSFMPPIPTQEARGVIPSSLFACSEGALRHPPKLLQTGIFQPSFFCCIFVSPIPAHRFSDEIYLMFLPAKMGHCVHDLSLFKNELLLLSQAGKKEEERHVCVAFPLPFFFSIHILYYTIIVKKSK